MVGKRKITSVMLSTRDADETLFLGNLHLYAEVPD
jgi:hypothetical protein